MIVGIGHRSASNAAAVTLVLHGFYCDSYSLSRTFHGG